MKKSAAVLAVSALIIAFTAATVCAGENISQGDITKIAGNLEIPADTLVNGDVTVKMGETVVRGFVNGNVTANMGRVVIYGDVNGNVEANMGEVVINGKVAGDVNANLGRVDVEGFIGGSLSSDLGDVHIGGTVSGDVEMGLGNLHVPGEVQGSIFSRGKTVSVTGSVGGDIILSRGIVELGARSDVAGEVYVEKGLVKAEEGARTGSILVVEELTEAEVDRLFRQDGFRFGVLEEFFSSLSDGISSFVKKIPFVYPRNLDQILKHLPFSFLHWPGHFAQGLYNMIIALALAVLTFTFFPQQVKVTAGSLTGKTGAALGYGALTALLMLPLSIALTLTIIGIPLLFAVFLLLILVTILGYTAIAHIIGEKVLQVSSNTEYNPLAAIALGVLLLGILTMVPLLGSLVSLALFIMAVGGVLASRFGRGASR